MSVFKSFARVTGKDEAAMWKPGGAGAQSPVAHPSSSERRISCPSFNDFSMFTAEEFATEYAKYDSSRGSSIAEHRVSDSASPLSPPLAVAASGFDLRGAPLAASVPLEIPTDIKPMNTPPPLTASSFAASSSVPNSTCDPLSPGARRKYKEGKIDGLDYYEFCELMRN